MSVRTRARGPRAISARSPRAASCALAAGVLGALSLPPRAIWPLSILAAGLLCESLRGLRRGARAGAGAIFGLSLYAGGLLFISQFTLLGFLAAVLVEAAFLALACAFVPPGRGRYVGVVGACVLAEAARETVPFGGVPLGSLALANATGPLGPLARVGGPLAVVAGVFASGALLSALVDAGRTRTWRAATGPCAGALALVGTLLFCSSALAANSASRGAIQAVAVQGGGPRGLSAIESPTLEATVRTLAASGALAPGKQDLVVWPEDTLPLGERLGGRSVQTVAAALARRVHATLLVGATRREARHRFANEALVFGPRGAVRESIEKVHAVPFGEYVPWRGLFAHLVNLSSVPLDAIAGKSPEDFSLHGQRLGVVLSFEAFFPALARADVRAGALAVVLPTNTASYASAQVPAQELAAVRLDALSTGRSFLLVATTGYSALVDANGTVERATGLGAAGVLHARLGLTSAMTPYDDVGSSPTLLASACALGLGWLVNNRRSASARLHGREALG